MCLPFNSCCGCLIKCVIVYTCISSLQTKRIKPEQTVCLFYYFMSTK